MKKIFQSRVFQIIGGVLIVTSGLFFGYITELLAFRDVVFGVMFLMVISVLSVVLYASYANSKIQENFTDHIDMIKEFIEANGLGDIINSKTLSVWEEHAESVWVISQDMSNDVEYKDCDIFQSVKHNLLRGMQYVYFVPDTALIRGRLNEFYTCSHHGNFKKGQVKICLIPSESYHFISETVLYDVEKDKNTRSVQLFPNKMSDYYIALDTKHQNQIVGTLKYLRKKYSIKDIDEALN